MPSSICERCAASISALPRKAPTQGVQPTENIIPKSSAEKKPGVRGFAPARPPRRKPRLKTPRYERPKIITTAPETMLTSV